jgi:hypothetical protein
VTTTNIDGALADTLRRAGISPAAWARFSAAESAALKRDADARTAGRRGRPPMRATLRDLNAAVRAVRPVTVADKLAAVAAAVYGRKVAA